MLRGRSVGLRPIEPSDLEFLQELANHREVANLVVGWDFPLALHTQADWLAQSARSGTTRRLAVVDLASGEIVGMTGLWDIDWHNRTAMSAVKLHPDRARPGMGTDAVKITMAWAFADMGLHRVYGAILDFNGPSLGVYVRKCGWRVEGVERESVFRKGRWCDLYRVAILDREFFALADAAEYVDRVCPVDVHELVDVDRVQAAVRSTHDGAGDV